MGYSRSELDFGRLIDLLSRPKAYLDVETDFSGSLSVVGISLEDRKFVQFYGEDITSKNLKDALFCAETILTFNGESFDFPVIKRCLGLDLRASHKSVDLCILKRRLKIRGGLKEIERLFGIDRKTKGIMSSDAPKLWRSYWLYGDLEALKILLEYNREDVLNLIELEKHLLARIEALYGGEVRGKVQL